MLLVTLTHLSANISIFGFSYLEISVWSNSFKNPQDKDFYNFKIFVYYMEINVTQNLRGKYGINCKKSEQ
jgi:hypothetical protein